MTHCLVTARDFATYWQHGADVPDSAPTWSGIERRCGPVDRRANIRDRRWDSQRSRRYRWADRRKVYGVK